MRATGGVKQVNQYAVVRFLGKGSFAEVFLCQDKKSKRDVAVKVFQKSILRRKRRMARTAKGVVVSSELDKARSARGVFSLSLLFLLYFKKVYEFSI